MAKHLVMAGRYLDDEPRKAFEHASAAASSGGRVSLVREAVGVAAYAAGEYAAALRELRTFRRISGSSIHLPLMADSERGLGRPEKALELAQSDEAKELDTAGQVEMAIVRSGALGDLERFDEALAALEIPQLDINRGFSFSPRLFRAYGEALTNVDRAEEAERWFSQAVVAERALGLTEEDEDDVDFFDAEEEFEDEAPSGTRKSEDSARGGETAERVDEDAPEAEAAETHPGGATSIPQPAERERGAADENLEGREKDQGGETPGA
ncbi:hypothetical protein [Arthrobacter sp. UM1]|uniref:hypothetical protein n=1 Tax=Arthrobacter sp. UM1 TaxID=2766776 RepID=UPI001CF63216|nr:hypothetical protein [Arthrobacter sp. UM1]MCB4207177.1 hypothetical protein [Arthrobacter sp. UM1]